MYMWPVHATGAMGPQCLSQRAPPAAPPGPALPHHDVALGLGAKDGRAKDAHRPVHATCHACSQAGTGRQGGPKGSTAQPAAGSAHPHSPVVPGAGCRPCAAPRDPIPCSDTRLAGMRFVTGTSSCLCQELAHAASSTRTYTQVHTSTCMQTLERARWAHACTRHVCHLCACMCTYLCLLCPLRSPNSVMCTAFSVSATPPGPRGISLTSGMSMGCM